MRKCVTDYVCIYRRNHDVWEYINIYMRMFACNFLLFFFNFLYFGILFWELILINWYLLMGLNRCRFQQIYRMQLEARCVEMEFATLNCFPLSMMTTEVLLWKWRRLWILTPLLMFSELHYCCGSNRFTFEMDILLITSDEICLKFTTILAWIGQCNSYMLDLLNILLWSYLSLIYLTQIELELIFQVHELN